MEGKSSKSSIEKSLLKQLNMTEEQLDETASSLVSWLKYQPHLPHSVGKNVLKSFIIGCRSVELAKEKLQNYFVARLNYPNVVKCDPLKIQWNKIQPMAYLPDLTPEGYLVLFMTLPDLNELPEFDFAESLKYWLMMTEIIIRERCYCAGQIVVADIKNFSLKLIPKFSVTALSSGIYVIEEAFPFPTKEIININSPQGIDFVRKNIFQPLMKESIYNMILSYTEDGRILEKHIPNKILPKDYGGEAPTLAELTKNWQNKLEQSRSLFLEELNDLPDPSKIPSKLKEDTRFGTSGTFRKLDID